jgi:hypothetical protein
MGFFIKKTDSGLEGMMPKQELRGWVKWTVGVLAIGTAGYFANHYTGDRTGLEKLITGKSISTAQYSGANPQAKGSVQRARFPSVIELKAELLKQGLYFVLLERNGLRLLAAAQPIKPIVTDNSHTAIEKFYLITIDASYKVKLTEPDEAFLKELNEGKISIITGYQSTSPSARTQTQQGQPNPLLRIFR